MLYSTCVVLVLAMVAVWLLGWQCHRGAGVAIGSRMVLSSSSSFVCDYVATGMQTHLDQFKVKH